MNKSDLIHRSGLYKIFRPFYSGMGHVLMYHRVGHEKLLFTRDLQVTPEHLEQTLQYFISRHIDIVSLEECHNRITSGRREGRFVAFTFDDGFRDNLTNALPVFEKYDAPFALFLTTGFPDRRIVLWSYMLEDLVINNSEIEFSDEGRLLRYPAAGEDEKREAYREIRNYILSSSQDNLLTRLEHIFHTERENLYSLTGRMALSWEEVRELSDHPLVTIGSHTVNHFALSELPEEEVTREISDAMGIIEKRTGKPVAFMAYPYGMSSAAGPREFEIAGRSGLKLAFTTVSGNIMKRHADQLYALPRIEMRDEWGDRYLDLYLNGYTPLLQRLAR